MTKNEIDQNPFGTHLHRDFRSETPAFKKPMQESPAPETPGNETPVRKRRGRSSRGWVLSILIIGIGLYATYHFLMPQAEPVTNSENSPQTVGVATISRGDVIVDIEALGTVTPLANITVKTQISGQLIRVGFKEGQIVKEGDFLAQIDDRPYVALKHQYEGQLAHDKGLLEQAIADNIRYQTLLNQTSIARQTAENQKLIVQQDEGTVKSDEGLIEAQNVNIAYCHVVAPVTGRVGLRQVDPGNYVQTSDTNGLVVLTELQPISVIFSVPENLIPQVQDGQKVSDELQAIAFDQANLHQLAIGTLETLDNTIDTTTGMVKARASFTNLDNALYPNQFVNIHLDTGKLHDVVVAPNAAVQRGSFGTFAYIVKADNTIGVRKIVLGPSQGTMVVITEGLLPGDRVVIDGSDRLREGTSVVVAEGANLPATARVTKDPKQNLGKGRDGRP